MKNITSCFIFLFIIIFLQGIINIAKLKAESPKDIYENIQKEFGKGLTIEATPKGRIQG
jgi:hypothetical protein